MNLDDPKNVSDVVLNEQKTIIRVIKSIKQPPPMPAKISKNEIQTHIDLIDNFISWRDKTLVMFNTKCKVIPLVINKKIEKELKNIADVPKCMVRLSYEVCECDPLCALNIINGSKIDYTCGHYDLDKLNDNVVLNNCNFLRLKSYNPDFLDDESHFKYRRNIFDAMDDFYYWYKDFPSAVNCISYEINCDETKGFCTDKKDKLQLIHPPYMLENILARDQFISYNPPHKYFQRKFKKSIYEGNGDIKNETMPWTGSGNFLSQQKYPISSGSISYNISASLLICMMIFMIFKFAEIPRKFIVITFCLIIGILIMIF